MVAARVGAEAGRAAITAASQNAEQFSYFADTLLRPAAPAPGQPGQAAAPAQAQQPAGQDVRAEVSRILARSALNRELSQNDRNYLSTIVAQRTGVPPEEAQRRVTETFNNMEQTLRDAADKTDSGEDVRQEASMIKVFATEMAYAACDHAMQTLGALGMTLELPLNALSQKARLMRMYEGPSEVHRQSIARRVLGLRG